MVEVADVLVVMKGQLSRRMQTEWLRPRSLELPELELDTPQTSQSINRRSNDGLFTTQSEDFSTRCRLLVVNRTQQTSGREHFGCDKQRCCVHNRSALRRFLR